MLAFTHEERVNNQYARLASAQVCYHRALLPSCQARALLLLLLLRTLHLILLDSFQFIICTWCQLTTAQSVFLFFSFSLLLFPEELSPL